MPTEAAAAGGSHPPAASVLPLIATLVPCPPARRSRDQTAVATAIVFLHKYYAVRSIERNDPFVSR